MWVTTGHPPEALKAAGAFLLIADFTDPQLWKYLERS